MDHVYERLTSHPNSGQRLIGIEVERFLVKEKPLRYEPQVRTLLEALVAQKGWVSSYEVDGKLLAITKDGHAISIEPGGQFEVSSGPQESVGILKKIKDDIDEEVISVLPDPKVQFLCVGLNPWESPDDISLLPSPRYRLMDKHFKKVGGRGREMMRLSLGLQVNLDIQGEEMSIEMLKVGYYTAPALSALFANSPFSKGKRTPHLSDRHFVWRETDAARSGIPAFIFEEGFCLKAYAEYVRRTPLMYAFDAEGKVWDPEGRSFDDLDPAMQEVNALPAIRQIFTEVRLKPCCVEVRYFDQVDDDHRYAATALTTGILYDDENRAHFMKKFAGVKAAQLSSVMKIGAETGLRNDEIYESAKEILAYAEKGLVRRGLGEEAFLVSAERLIRERKTPAENLRIRL